MRLQRAPLYCTVRPFLKPQGFCYSIALIKGLHCQDAFVLQTLISKRSLTRERLELYFVLWIYSAWDLYLIRPPVRSSAFFLFFFYPILLFNSINLINNCLFIYKHFILCIVCVRVFACAHTNTRSSTSRG